MPLTINDQELDQLQKMLDLMPHGYAKKLDHFFFLVKAKRDTETKATEQKEQTRLKEEEEQRTPPKELKARDRGPSHE